jgi:L-lactate dehydrogenase complex protein LldG
MSREEMLARVRSALWQLGAAQREIAVAGRLAYPPATLLPQRAQGPAAELLAAFKTRLEAQGTDLIAVAQAALIPSAIAGYLNERCLPLRLRRGSNRLLASLPWAEASGLAVSEGPATGATEVGLSRASAGIAETGTLLLASGPDNPVTLAFLPDTHIVVLAKSAIVGSYEEAVGRIQGGGEGVLPRTLNFITGASRTGDIGGRIVMGAHGPRRLAVVLVDEG